MVKKMSIAEFDLTAQGLQPTGAAAGAPSSEEGAFVV
jgi:hypothetical protein